LLNELYSLVTEIIFRHGGIVDKFIGDSVMAAWGTPAPAPDHASKALDAAEDIQRFVAVANDDWEERYGVRIRMAIGLNTGECVAGSLGSDKRLDYTLIGDVVNVAARLEREAAPDQVLITERTRDCADPAFETTFIGEHRLSGRRNFTRVYALELVA
jgi:class 3 adenylate cyclase